MDRLARHVKVGPGAPGHVARRKEATAALAGYVTGVVASTGFAVARDRIGRPRTTRASALALSGVAMAAGDVPATLLGVTDPRRWTTTDWLSDVVPHLAYGIAAAAVLHRCAAPDRAGTLDRVRRRTSGTGW